MLNLRRWEPIEYPALPTQKKGPDGELLTRKEKVRDKDGKEQEVDIPVMEPGPTLLTFEMKRPTYVEARVLGKAYYSAFRDEEAKTLYDQLSLIPDDEVRKLFVDGIRNVRGAALDGAVVADGQQLFDVADNRLVLFVIRTALGLAGLTEVEGKDSASRSTSSAEVATPAGESDAPHTEHEAGTAR